jgi:oligopeptidase B
MTRPDQTHPHEPAAEATSPPVADKRPRTREHHGDVFVDDYEWLRDKTGADTVAYLEAENAYTASRTAHLSELREQIFTEIKQRTQETDLSVPSRNGSHWYYQRTAEGAQYPVLCRAAAAADDWTPPQLDPATPVPGEEVLVDCNTLAEGGDFFSLGAFTVSLDDRVLAYSTDLVGDERYTIYLLDLATAELLPDRVENSMAGATWSADGAQLFYSTVDDAWRPDKVWRHQVGTDTTADVLVHDEVDDRYWTGIGRTTSDRFLLIESHSKVTSEVRILEADDPTGDFRVLVPRTPGVEYHVEHAVIGGDDHLVVVHNQDAVNFSLGVGPLSLSSLDQLETLLAGSDEVRIGDVDVSATTLALNLREDGLPKVRVYPLTDAGIGAGTTIDFGEEIFTAVAAGFSDWRQPFVRVHYSSWVTPGTVYEYDPATEELHLRKRQPVLGGYDPADYVQTREWVTARDGARIPISLVRHKSVPANSGAPLLLYGYGSYEISMDPSMSISRLSLLDRGMVYVVAHIRGGGEMGRLWYEQGKLLAKKNTFFDYVDCAQYLVDTGWTDPEHLVGLGGSAGGLLMGAVANLAPDLFAGIVAHVPFVDALTTILDPSLPLTVIEWDEWGDPLHDAEVYAYMKSYTPYENIAERAYPAIYAITSINDTRVYYVEPAKWVAKLRDTVPDDRAILLKCEMSAGHGGASGRYDSWRETADYYAWVVEQVGATHQPRGTAG